MALRPCKECRNEVSRSAKRCPHCGKKNPTGGLTVPAKLFLLVVGALVLADIWSHAGQSSAAAITPSTTQAAQPAKTNHARQQAPPYHVVKTDDDSYGSVRRLNIRVRLPSHYSHSEVLRVAKAVVASVVQKERVNAVSVMCYGPHANTDGAWDVARVDWAPHGNWSEAGNVRTGQYDSFLYRVDYRAPQPAGSASSSLRPSGQRGLLGAPLPVGATLVEQRPGDPSADQDPYERYHVSATAEEIAAYFNREMFKAGWLKDGTSTKDALFFTKGGQMLGVLIHGTGGFFALMGS